MFCLIQAEKCLTKVLRILAGAGCILLAMVALGLTNYFFLAWYERRRQRKERASLTDL